MANQLPGDFEVAKARAATEIYKALERTGSPREIAAAKVDLERARAALIKAHPEAAALDEIRKALLHPVRLGGRKVKP